MKYEEGFLDNNEIQESESHTKSNNQRMRIFWCLLLTSVIISVFGGYYYGIYDSTGGYNYYVSYILDKNETLSDLSKEFLPIMSTSIGIKKIMAANGISNSDQILFKGDKLWIPTQKTSKPFYMALYDSIIGYNYFFEYEINSGDTLEKLAGLMLPNLSINEGIKKIMAANNIDTKTTKLSEINFITPIPKTKQKTSSNNSSEQTMSLNADNIKNRELIEGIKLWIPTGRLAPYLKIMIL